MMTPPRVSVERIKIAVAALALLLFAQTAFWLVYDMVDRGVGGAWTAWTTGPEGGFAATSSVDLGLAALQLAAVCAVLRGTRGAGGLLVTSSAMTIAFRLPPVWYMLLDSPSDPWFGKLEGPSLPAIGVTALIALLLAAALGGLLLFVRHLENEAAAAAAALDELSGTGLRPMKVTASASGLLLAVLNVFYIGRNTNTVVQTESGLWIGRLIGRGTVQAVLGVSNSWQWASLTVVCGAGMYLALRRRPVANGFSLGLSFFMFPLSFASLAGAITAGTLTDSAVGSAQNLLELLGAAAVVGLVFRESRLFQQARRQSGLLDPLTPSTVGPVPPPVNAPRGDLAAAAVLTPAGSAVVAPPGADPAGNEPARSGSAGSAPVRNAAESEAVRGNSGESVPPAQGDTAESVPAGNSPAESGTPENTPTTGETPANAPAESGTSVSGAGKNGTPVYDTAKGGTPPSDPETEGESPRIASAAPSEA